MLWTGRALSLGLCLLAWPILAQELTEEQILGRFDAQREMYRSTVAGQKTRGLDMVVVTPDSTPAPAAPGEGIAPQGSTETVVFGQFDPTIQVNVAIRFAFDSARIASDQQGPLEKMCSVMRKSDVALFRIVGHTDALGSEGYNEALSRQRAEAVRHWLIQDCGIDAARLEALGMGKRFLANPDDPAGPENRRVEFQAIG